MSEAPDRYPSPEDIRRFVRSLGPTTLLDLFAGYGIPEEARASLLEETLALLVVERPEGAELRLWFLETLEERCQVYLERLQTEEEAQNDGPASDA
jgi:hypothetical protein